MTSSESTRYIASNFSKKSVELSYYFPARSDSKGSGGEDSGSRTILPLLQHIPKVSATNFFASGSAGISQTCRRLTDSGERHSHTECYSKIPPAQE